VEALEQRFMLSLPAVANVTVGSTQWSSSFLNYLESSGQGTNGYSVPVGSSNQLKTLSWTNVNQVRIRFTENVSVAAADLSVSGVNTTAYSFSNFTYDANTWTAVWTLSTSIAKDKVFFDLDADGMDPVRSTASGDILDGAWTDCVSTYPSGNGSGGQDFQFRVNVLPGDADGNNAVNLTDLLLVRGKVGKNAGDAGYNARYDVDGSGGITWDDYGAVNARLGHVLPSGNPVGMTDDAPTTSGIPDVSVNENAPDEYVPLLWYFDDAEQSSGTLAYSVVGNTNPSLFTSLTIDSYGGLTLDFAPDTHGDAVLTIQATDNAGLIVTTTLVVHVNAAPVIANFTVTYVTGYTWTLQGTVSDADDAVSGLVVTFGGVFAGYSATATVQADGTFSLTQEFVGLQSGTATAQTQDAHGAVSNLATYEVTVT
jgi:hypothetical protein